MTCRRRGASSYCARSKCRRRALLCHPLSTHGQASFGTPKCMKHTRAAEAAERTDFIRRRSRLNSTNGHSASLLMPEIALSTRTSEAVQAESRLIGWGLNLSAVSFTSRIRQVLREIRARNSAIDPILTAKAVSRSFSRGVNLTNRHLYDILRTEHKMLCRTATAKTKCCGFERLCPALNLFCGGGAKRGKERQTTCGIFRSA